MDTNKVIGWNVKRLRVSQGISQMDLALAAGIDPSYVGRVERGEENVTVARLDSISKVLNVPVAALFLVPPKLTPIPRLPAGRKPNSKLKKPKK